jgi:hypothetical protein
LEERKRTHGRVEVGDWRVVRGVLADVLVLAGSLDTVAGEVVEAVVSGGQVREGGEGNGDWDGELHVDGCAMFKLLGEEERGGGSREDFIDFRIVLSTSYP